MATGRKLGGRAWHPFLGFLSLLCICFFSGPIEISFYVPRPAPVHTDIPCTFCHTAYRQYIYIFIYIYIYLFIFFHSHAPERVL